MVGEIAPLVRRLETLEGQLRDLGAEQAKTLDQVTAASRQVAQVAALVQGGRDEPARPPTPGAPDRETAPGREKAPEPALHHHLRPDETLWSIAKRYYGHGWLYPVLIEQNPGLGVYHGGVGMLSLFADPARALDLYRQITPPGAEGRLFRYQVQPGDDWHGLARRFLGRPRRAPELIALNPGSDLAPGSRILIPLE
nr:LysM peptidoglycan-binding domain-containing protein [Thiorhodococcus mannitoliphagus]